MPFQWLGTNISLQGIRDNYINESSSTQLKRIQATKSCLDFYHLEMSIANNIGRTNLYLLLLS